MRPYITVVTGVPRSGTSLVMQMLAAGGLPPMTDAQRTADEDNPHGYFEFEQVKRLGTDQSWLSDARGRAVKIIYRLLYEVAPQHDCRIIFVRRDLEEVAASQAAMLARMGRPAGKLSNAEVSALFAQELQAFEAWLAQRPQWPVLQLEHRQLVADPQPEAQRIAEFLGGDLDVSAMAAAVDAGLYRQRRS